MRRAFVTALVVGALAPAGGAGADGGVIAGGAIPRVEPFVARAVPCGERSSCLDITWRVRGALGPRLRWDLTVLRPDGLAVFRGAGRSSRGRRVSGRLWPSSRPRCGRYRVLLRVEDPRGDHIEESRTAVRRQRCARPAR
jgi:hypothetical protein